MQPTKSMVDYMTEINRLFPRSMDDLFSPPTPMGQFFNQSMARSSSSTDTSPESFPDTIGYRSPTEHLLSPVKPDQSPARPDYVPRPDKRLEYSNNTFEQFPQQIYETPPVRRQRPIYGRKIITENLKQDEISKAWTEEPRTPTKAHINQNEYYELFPPNAKGIQNKFKTTRTSYMSPNPSTAGYLSPTPSNVYSERSNMSPYASSMSQWTETMSEVSDLSMTPSMFYPRSPGSSASHSTIPSRFSFKEPMTGPSTSLCATGSSKLCTFCRKNGETPLVYTTHKVKEKIGNKNVVTCPILRSHVCSICGAFGDNSHTISYCPVLRSTNNGRPLPSTTITLKNTRVKSNGRRRF